MTVLHTTPAHTSADEQHALQAYTYNTEYSGRTYMSAATLTLTPLDLMSWMQRNMLACRCHTWRAQALLAATALQWGHCAKHTPASTQTTMPKHSHKL